MAKITKKAKTVKAPQQPYAMQPAWRLAGQTISQMWEHKRLFLSLVGWYVLLTILLVNTSKTTTNYQDLQKIVTSHDGFQGILYGIGWLITTGGGVLTQATAFAGTIVFLVMSMATVYAVRHLEQQGRALRLRTVFYNGMFPLVPVLLTGLLIVVQLLPLALSSTIYSVLISTGIIRPVWLQALATVIVIGPLIWTLFLLAAALPAFYISCLPDVTPLQALRTARKLVAGRRAKMVRKTGFIIAGLIIALAVILLPIVYVLPPAAPGLSLVLVLTAVIIFHAYMYRLYTDLLK